MTAPAPVYDSFPDEAHQDLLHRAFAADQRILDQTISVGDAMMLINGLAQLAGTLGAAIPDAASTHQVLRDADAAETTRAKAAEQTNATAITGEATARQQADTNLAASITSLNGAVSGLSTSLTALAARVTALEALRIRGTTGTGTATSLIAAGTSTVVVKLAAAMPDTNYVALPIIDATTGLNLSTITATVTAKTTTTVTVQVKNSGLSVLSTVNLTVLAIQLS